MRTVPTLKDIIRCPKCGGSEIVYSCEPKCCFNHVCADCRSTFEINTLKTGRFMDAPMPPAEEPQSGEPTTCCAACESLRVGVLQSQDYEALLFCAQCGAISKMVIEEFVEGSF
jgi:transcription elongation factor Elf1